MNSRYSLRKRSTTMACREESRKSPVRQKLINHCSETCLSLADGVDDCCTTKIGPRGWKRFLKPVLFITVFVIIALLLIFFLNPKSDTVCYIRVGCFSVSGPWAERPTLFNFFPQSPSVINTTFIVTSRQDPNGQHGIVTLPNFGHFGLVNEADIPWNQSSLIVFLIHGYTDLSGTWMQTLKDAFLAQLDDIIVVLVDWESGASGYYPQVVSNTRVVARETSLFIRYIQRKFGRSTPKRVHLVGHSLGSQISSYVGKSFTNSSYEIFQITALDPAFPMFEGYCPEIRLHKSDAHHVLAIHSNIGPWGLGMKDPVGTVDIYLNDGRDQRGCPKLGGILKDEDTQPEPTEMKVDNQSLPKILNTLSNLKDLLACSHRRAYEWLEDVLWDLAGTPNVYSSNPILSTSVIAYPINWERGTNIVALAKNRTIHFGFCQEHGKSGCWKLEKDENNAFFRLPSLRPNESSSFLMPTSNKSPFCVRYARLELYTCQQLYSQKGSPFLPEGKQTVLVGSKTLSLSQVSFDEEMPIYQGQLHESPTLLKGWVEFPCDELRKPVNLKNGLASHPHQNGSHKSYLSVKLLVSLDVSGSRKNEQENKSGSSSTKGTSATKLGVPNICVDRIKLVFYNESAKDIVRLSWQAQKMDGDNTGKMLISSNECVEIIFPFKRFHA